MPFQYHDFIIPINKGYSTGRGWRTVTDKKPMGVTWHWTAMPDLLASREILRGGSGDVASPVSSHYCVGRNYSEGVDRYVTLKNTSWHAGKNQILRWDGRKSTQKTKATRTCIGIETAHIGYARDGYPAEPHWGEFVDTDCKKHMRIPPWPDEQIAMMIAVGKEIRNRWDHIPWQHHHGHHDICPSYKSDVAGFPFARILRGIYDDPTIPDIWSPLWTVSARQRVLIALGYGHGAIKDNGVWDETCETALTAFQRDKGAVVIPYWTTFTNQDAYTALAEKGLDLTTVAETPAG